MPSGWISLLLFSSVAITAAPVPARADLECQAKIANRLFYITLDKTTREMKVKTDNGYEYEANASYKYNPRIPSTQYFLSVGAAAPMELNIETSGSYPIWFCDRPNECAPCK